MSTIVILSHINNDASLYCSYNHSHAKALVKEGHKVIVFAMNNYFPFIKNKIKKEVIYDNGVEIRYLNRISFSNILYNSKININGLSYYMVVKKEIKKILKHEKINLIDAHTYKVEGYAAYLLKKKFKIKTFVTIHGTSFERNLHAKNGKKEIKKIGDTIDYYICVSTKLQKSLQKLKIYNTKVIYNGIEKYSVKHKNVDFNIITVGSFDKSKNIDLVIKSFKYINDKYKDTKLTIVGCGTEKENYINLVNDLKLNDKVFFTGLLSNKEVFNQLSKNQIFILPSKPEGFGICYVEAMYSGCITIGTEDEGIDGFIKNGYNGFLIKPNINEITKLITDIFEEKYNLEEIKKMAYKDAKSLTWKKNAKEYLMLVGDKNESVSCN